jgi:hypothetical protein
MANTAAAPVPEIAAVEEVVMRLLSRAPPDYKVMPQVGALPTVTSAAT